MQESKLAILRCCCFFKYLKNEKGEGACSFKGGPKDLVMSRSLLFFELLWLKKLFYDNLMG